MNGEGEGYALVVGVWRGVGALTKFLLAKIKMHAVRKVYMHSTVSCTIFTICYHYCTYLHMYVCM